MEVLSATSTDAMGKQVEGDAGTGSQCCSPNMLAGNRDNPYGFCQISCGQCGYVAHKSVTLVMCMEFNMKM